MTGSAEIRLTDRPGIFVAEMCTLEHGVIHARGHFRRRTGANYADVQFGPEQRYSWPLRQCAEILWTDELAAA